MIPALILSSCQPEEEQALQPAENLPSIEEALANFDQELDFEDEEPNARFRRVRVPTFFTLIKALQATDLLKVVAKNKLTIFAPDDIAFAKIGITPFNVHQLDKDFLSNVLLYHALPGLVRANQLSDCYEATVNEDEVKIIRDKGHIFVKGESNETPAKVIFANLRALNGILHVVNQVLLPPDKTIAAIASAAPNFSTLVSLVTLAGLAPVVADEAQNLTVFAPDNEAFGKLKPEIVAYLTSEAGKDDLILVLKTHIVGGRVFSCDLANGQVPTLNTPVTIDVDNLTISTSINTVELNADALDIQANNGVIHGIKQVLIPGNLSIL